MTTKQLSDYILISVEERRRNIDISIACEYHHLHLRRQKLCELSGLQSILNLQTEQSRRTITV